MHEAQSRLALFLRNLGDGGAERMMLNMGVKVDLVLTQAEGTYLAQVPPEVRIVDLKTSQFDKGRIFNLPTSLQSTTSLPKLIRYLQNEQPAALLSATHYPNEIAVLAKSLARVPTRLVVSEHITLSMEARRVEQVSSRLAPLAARLFYPWADGILAVSWGVARDLAQITGLPLERIRVIHNPVLTPDLIEKAKEPVEHPWLALGELPVVMGVGRLVEQKDFSTLLRAFAKVRQVRPARLMILGSGRQQKQLNELARELNIENDLAWIGFTKNPFAYMARAAVFVLSSAWEGLPTVLIEAMAVGTPVISTNCESGPAEILDNGKYGELVPVGNTEAMAEAILNVLFGNSKSVDSTWLDQFTLESATQKYLDILGIRHLQKLNYSSSGTRVSD
jgi:glycosyltransferase involved in cell wall biosynthesis